MRRLLGVALAAAVLAGILASPALADDSSASPEAKKVVLQVGWSQQLDSLNPFVGYENVSYEVYHLNYDMLVRYDPKTMEPVPGLAESWDVSDDGTVWTFHIRQGVTWQDGEPLTAKDVAFTFNYIIDNSMSAYTVHTTHIEKVTAVDDATVRFDLSQPRATMLQMWVPILPEHVWSKVDPEAAGTTFENVEPVGSGPFRVVEWKRNDYVRMAANKDYWGGAPKIDEILFRSYTNNETLAADLQTGAIDMSAYIDAAQFKKFTGKDGWGTSKATVDSFDELGFNCYDGESLGNPVLRDPAFRHALTWAIDTEQIARIAYVGAANPATTILPTHYWQEPLDYHWEPTDDVRCTFDLERAAEELDAAGYRDSDGDGIREDRDGKPISLRLWAITDKGAYASAGKLITGWLEEIGLEIDYSKQDGGNASDHMYNFDGDTFKPDFDMFIWGWNGNIDPNFLLSLFTKSQIGAWSDCNWGSDEYDALYAEQEACLDPQERKDVIWRMQQLLYEESPYIVLAYPLTLEVYNTQEWQGWVKQPAGSGGVANYWTYLSVQPRTTTQAVSSGLSGGAIAGIVVAALVAVGIVVGVVLWRRRSGGKAETIV